MKSQLVIVAIFGLACSGCVTYKTVNADKSCDLEPSDRPQVVKIKLKEKRNDKKKIEPPPVACAQPGDLLRFKIDTRNPKNASVEGKLDDVANKWIKGGTNYRERWFWVTVPYDVLEEDENLKSFFYNISVEDFPEIDPEVRVRRPN